MVPNFANFNKCVSPETKYLAFATCPNNRNLSSAGSSLTKISSILGRLKILLFCFKVSKIVLTSKLIFARRVLNFGLSRTFLNSPKVSLLKHGVIKPLSIKGINFEVLPGHKNEESKTFVSRITNIRCYFSVARTALISSSNSLGEICLPTTLNLLAISVKVRVIFFLDFAFGFFRKDLTSLSCLSIFSNLVSIWPFIVFVFYDFNLNSVNFKYSFKLA